MRRMLLPGCTVLLLLLVSFLLITFPREVALAHSTVVNLTPTATPDSSSVLNQANDVLARADQESNQTQNLLNTVNTYSQILGVVLALFGVVAVFLGVFGFSTNNGFRDLDKEWRMHLNELTKQQSEAEQKSKAITELTNEIEEKSREIENLRQEMLQKSKDIGDLEQLVALQEALTKRLEENTRHIEDNSNALLNYMLGERLQEQKRSNLAISAFERARALRPLDPQIIYALGRIYSNRGIYDRAITCLEDAITYDPSFAQAHMELGLTYRRRAESMYTQNDEQLNIEYEKAIEHLQEATHLLPNYEDALAGLGAIYRRMKRYSEALDYYEQAFEADPSSSYALGNVATLGWHEGKLEIAREAFQRTLELATARIDAGSSFEPFWDYYDRALAKLVLGRKEDALSDYDMAVKRTHGPKNFQSVLDTLKFLQEVQDRQSIEGLDEVIHIIEDARIKTSGTSLQP
jgi:tetratricopeptide (TPR) repeat protein